MPDAQKYISNPITYYNKHELNFATTYVHK